MTIKNNDVYDIANYFEYKSNIGLYDNFPNIHNKLYKYIKQIGLYDTTTVNNKLPDQISYEQYQTEMLWWVIIIYNDIIDPLTMDNLEYIKIPNISKVRDILVRLRSDIE